MLLETDQRCCRPTEPDLPHPEHSHFLPAHLHCHPHCPVLAGHHPDSEHLAFLLGSSWQPKRLRQLDSN
jgi:hypothetical protein